MASDKPGHTIASIGAESVISIQMALQDSLSCEVSHSDMYEKALTDYSAELMAVTIVAMVKKVLGRDPNTMISVINLAADLHSTDLRHSRAGGPKPYIIHPLCNTLRLLRLGAIDLPLLMASVLHDTVEDHPFELAAKAGVHTDDEEKARTAALSFLGDTFGRETARIVEGMSNPVLKDQNTTREQSNLIYFDHVRTATADPKVFACKVSDFIDNAVSLSSEDNVDPARLPRMAKKYYPVFDVLLERLSKGERDADLPMSTQGIQEVRMQLEIGRERLGKVLQAS